jgi:hypothetical protein
MDVETHQAVFQWVLKVLAEKKLLKGTTIGVNATTLEANAALRSIVRRDTGERYEEFLTRLAKEGGIETPTREQLAKLDRKRCMQTGGVFGESAASGCYGNAARSWSDGTNIYYDRGGMRRVHLRGRENILKRLVIHSGAANLGLLMRKIFGKGTPRGFTGVFFRHLFGYPSSYTPLVRAIILHRPQRWLVGYDQSGSSDFSDV